MSEQESSAIRLSGKKISATIYQNLKIEINKSGQLGTPGLATILIGDNPDSVTYVRMKRKKAQELGIRSFDINLDVDVTEEELINHVYKLNQDPDVHGILIQLPLPKHINENNVLNKVALEKDVDGFHHVNFGKLCMKDRTPDFISCTPKGCMRILDSTNIPIEGKHAVIIGRSNIVGIPMAMLLMHRNATVTICHSRTKNVEHHVKQADIVIAACGKPYFVKGEWIKKGAVVIDVGINSITDKTKKRGYRLVGDVEYSKAKENASFITPVPGGVGPMTICMLMENVFEAFKNILNRAD
jgi:5,10-methylene-tetrahydrofolate dehydrogenase/methenyl tetrahydrofolate cyclohydrolase